MIVVGGGLAGLSTAHHLSQMPCGAVAVIEAEEALMSVTSASSTGGYRNFYPAQPAMTKLASRSIALMEEIAHLTDNGARTHGRIPRTMSAFDTS